jgi:hypothetical protein
MLNFLGSIMSTMVTLLGYLWRETWRQVGIIFTSGWFFIISPFMVVCSVIYWIANNFGSLFSLLDYLAAVMPSVVVTSLGSVLPVAGAVNRVLPVAELFIFIPTFLVMKTLLIVYRTFKSWLPTLS